MGPGMEASTADERVPAESSLLSEPVADRVGAVRRPGSPVIEGPRRRDRTTYETDAERDDDSRG